MSLSSLSLESGKYSSGLSFPELSSSSSYSFRPITAKSISDISSGNTIATTTRFSSQPCLSGEWRIICNKLAELNIVAT